MVFVLLIEVSNVCKQHVSSLEEAYCLDASCVSKQVSIHISQVSKVLHFIKETVM